LRTVGVAGGRGYKRERRRFSKTRIAAAKRQALVSSFGDSAENALKVSVRMTVRVAKEIAEKKNGRKRRLTSPWREERRVTKRNSRTAERKGESRPK
jgi:hypothetical protein